MKIVAPNCALKPSKIPLNGFGGAVVNPKGMCVLPCSLNGVTMYLQIEIVDTDTVPLLGLEACIAFNLVNIRSAKNERTFLGKRMRSQ